MNNTWLQTLISNYFWTDLFIINFRDKYTYLSWKQAKTNHLLIETTQGQVDIVFTGEVPILSFNHFEKNQLVLNVAKKEVSYY